MTYKEVCLGDYFRFEKGLGYKGEFLVEESDVALIGMDSHEEGGGYKAGSEKFYSGPYKPEHVAEVGDVIFAGTEQGFGLLASPLMVPETDEFSTYLFSGDVLKAVPLRPDEFSVEYLYNLYRVEKYRIKAAYGDTGTTVRRISNENLAEQKVPLPDFPIQLAINEIIATIDQQISNNKMLSKSLERLLRSYFFTEIDQQITLDNYADIDLENIEKISSGIPVNWRVEPLSNYLSALESGKRPKGGGTLDSSGVPSIGAESITGLGEFNFSKTKYVPLDFFNKMKSGKFENLDILLYKDGAGAGNFVTIFGNGFPFSEFAVNEHVFLLRAKGISQLYLYLWLEQRKIRDLMVVLAQKSAQPGLNKANIAEIPIIIPPQDLLIKIDNFAKPLVEQILQNSLSNRTLDLTLRSIIPGLTSGRIQVPRELLAL